LKNADSSNVSSLSTEGVSYPVTPRWNSERPFLTGQLFCQVISYAKDKCAIPFDSIYNSMLNLGNSGRERCKREERINIEAKEHYQTAYGEYYCFTSNFVDFSCSM
jgi:hypothetical protein